MEVNAKTPLENMESTTFNTPDYKIEDITKFVSGYNIEGMSGIGILFLAESFNKAAACGARSGATLCARRADERGTTAHRIEGIHASLARTRAVDGGHVHPRDSGPAVAQ